MDNTECKIHPNKIRYGDKILQSSALGIILSVKRDDKIIKCKCPTIRRGKNKYVKL